MTYLALLFSIWAAIAVLQPAPKGGMGVRWLKRLGPYLVTGVVAPLPIWFWYFHRPQPAPHKEDLFRGISYERDVRKVPRPVVMHIARVDLGEPSISFLTSPRGVNEPAFGGSTTSEFLVKHDLQLAINGDFFLPWWSDGPGNFYPKTGYPVDVLGASVSNGVKHGWEVVPYSALVVGPDRKVSIVEVKDRNTPLPNCIQAISGKTLLVSNGRVTDAARVNSEAATSKHPRTAVALDEMGRTLMLVVVDGRQPGYSEGVSLAELSEFLVEHGAYRAINLDGGGSSTMVSDDGHGGYRTLNIPIHTRIPWRQRTVANHFGVFAEAL
ncbi:MAG: phosphodiester glycosidase family protein [Polyangiaceae bacterium]|nr:phosphodiester glycosidase family protein [Polyangiaceae bacterium]